MLVFHRTTGLSECHIWDQYYEKYRKQNSNIIGFVLFYDALQFKQDSEDLECRPIFFNVLYWLSQYCKPCKIIVKWLGRGKNKLK